MKVSLNSGPLCSGSSLQIDTEVTLDPPNVHLTIMYDYRTMLKHWSQMWSTLYHFEVNQACKHTRRTYGSRHLHDSIVTLQEVEESISS